ncbi:MAG: hypothetical protein QME12_02630 [Nanoarchaeota archaeon]|nr:hypothetical protein [Nanoarchaeota archaeon]
MRFFIFFLLLLLAVPFAEAVAVMPSEIDLCRNNKVYVENNLNETAEYVVYNNDERVFSFSLEPGKRRGVYITKEGYASIEEISPESTDVINSVDIDVNGCEKNKKAAALWWLLGIPALFLMFIAPKRLNISIYYKILNNICLRHYELEISHHAFIRAMEMEVMPHMIEATLLGGKLKRFGKHGIKLSKKYKRFEVVCVGEIKGQVLKIITIETKNEKVQ